MLFYLITNYLNFSFFKKNKKFFLQQATTTKVGVPVPSLATISTLQHDDVVELLISSQQRAHDVVDAKDLQHLAAAPVGDDVAVNETPEDVLNWRGLTVNYRISFLKNDFNSIG